jgi:hypothetical protein
LLHHFLAFFCLADIQKSSALILISFLYNTQAETAFKSFFVSLVLFACLSNMIGCRAAPSTELTFAFGTVSPILTHVNCSFVWYLFSWFILVPDVKRTLRNYKAVSTGTLLYVAFLVEEVCDLGLIDVVLIFRCKVLVYFVGLHCGIAEFAKDFTRLLHALKAVKAETFLMNCMVAFRRCNHNRVVVLIHVLDADAALRKAWRYSSKWRHHGDRLVFHFKLVLQVLRVVP